MKLLFNNFIRPTFFRFFLIVLSIVTCSLTAGSKINASSAPTGQEKTFLVIFGPPASGKMTIGQEIAHRTGLKLFYNHMVIDPLLEIFDFTDPHFEKLVTSFRTQIFEEAAHSDLRGIIFTFVWNFNGNRSRDSMAAWSRIFKDIGAKIYVVELVCDLEIRLERNRTENRLLHKPSKRNLEKSGEILYDNEKNWKMQSDENFSYGDKFFKINNNNKTASEVAQMIIEHFNL